MPQRVTFFSDGFELVGYLYEPAGLQPGESRAGVVVCHGFGAHQARVLPEAAQHLAEQGYVALTIDYRGFGESQGPRWRMIPQEQVRDIRNAITFLEGQPSVEPNRIGLWGTSFGGANVCYVAGVDQRQQVVSGQSRMVDRTYIMLPDPPSRASIEATLAQFPEMCRQLPLETARAVLDFHPEQVVGQVSPRALLFIVAGEDGLVLNELTRELFDRAGEPKQWITIPGLQHYEMYLPENLSRALVHTSDWLSLHLPPRQASA